MKVGITLDENLVTRIDRFADENYMSRSGFISLSCTHYLNSVEVTKAIKDLSVCMRKIADTGKLDRETIEQLEDFERLANVLHFGK